MRKRTYAPILFRTNTSFFPQPPGSRASDWSTEEANIASDDNVGSDAIVTSGSVRVGGYMTFRNQHQTSDGVMGSLAERIFCFFCISDFEIGELGNAWVFLQL